MTSILNFLVLNSLISPHSTQLQCGVDVITTVQEVPTSVLILKAENDLNADNALGVIHQFLSKSVKAKIVQFNTLTKFKYPEHPFIAAAETIIWIIDTKELLEQIKMVRFNMLWNSSSKIILIIPKSVKNIEDIFSTLWEHARVCNIVAISVESELYSWFPYNRNTCNSNITAVNLGKCSDLILKPSIIFPEKIKNNLNGCSIYGATSLVYPHVGIDPKTHQPTTGVEVSIINAVAEKYNAKMTYKQSPEGESFYGLPEHMENHVGAAGLLERYEVDLGYGCWFSAPVQITFSHPVNPPHNNDKILWFIPQPQKIPEFENLFRAFEIDIWLSVLVALICTAATLHISDLLGHAAPQIGLQVINAMAITLNLGISPMPKARIIKSLLMVCFFYGVHVATAYQSSLTSFFTKPIMDEPIKSVREGVEKGLVLYLYEPLRHFVLAEGFPDQKLIMSSPHVFKDTMSYHLMTNFQDKMIFGARDTVVFYMGYFKKVNEHNQLLLRALEPGVLSFFATFLVSRGNPLKGKLDITVAQLIEGGFREKWMADFLNRNQQKGAGFSADGHIALNLNVFSGAFFILIFGLLIALLTCLGELGASFLKRKNHKEIPQRRIRVVQLQY